MNTNDIHIALPASKSESNRLLVLNHLLGGVLRISNLSTSDDTVLLRKLLAQLKEGRSTVYYCDNCGTVARFMTALLAVTPGSHFITGDERLRERPIAPLVEALNGMGLNVKYAQEEGRLPLQIEGQQPRRKMAYITPAESSQYVSALLLLSPALPDGITVQMRGKVPSKSYIDMTCKLLERVGFTVKHSVTGRVIMVGKPQGGVVRQTIGVGQDWSAAAFFYEVAAMFPQYRLRLTGLGLDSIQGDAVAAEYFARLGVRSVEVRPPFRKSSVASLRIQGGGELSKTRLYYTFRNCPDLMPAVAVAGAYLGQDVVLAGIENLRHKESDRVAAVAAELEAMGCKISYHGCGDMHIHPSKQPLQPTRAIRTYGDHRIAMAMAPLQLAYGQLEIENPEVVSKSFPDFWRQLEEIKMNSKNE